jgi:hypothetical protein
MRMRLRDVDYCAGRAQEGGKDGNTLGSSAATSRKEDRALAVLVTQRQGKGRAPNREGALHVRYRTDATGGLGPMCQPRRREVGQDGGLGYKGAAGGRRFLTLSPTS